MFLRCHPREKDGKLHRYWSIVESRRVTGGGVVQRRLLYLGEINDSQREAWRKSIEVLEDGVPQPRQIALFPEDRQPAVPDEAVVQIRLRDLTVRRPRQWGACWLACHLWAELGLDTFWAAHLPPSRKGTRWDLILTALSAYRLLDPGSEWRLHREWYLQSAMPDLLGAGYELVEIHKRSRCLDHLLPSKRALFAHLTARWRDLFNLTYEVLLYDLTSTYFESEPPEDPHGKRRFGYSRDKRRDCVQLVLALIITPEGFPLAYEVLAGNVTDNRTLRLFLRQIERRYGKAERIWLLDRGIPTEATLAQMRASAPPVRYLVGTPKGRLSTLEAALLEQPWQQVRDGIAVKLLPQAGELYVLARSTSRVGKERAIRRKQLKRLWRRLRQLQGMALTRDKLLLKLGAARQRWPAAWRLVQVDPQPDGTLRFGLNRAKLRQVRRREGRYLLRTNLTEGDPAGLWELYMRPALRGGGGVQDAQGRPRPAAHPPSGPPPDRGTYLRGLPRLRAPRDAAPTLAGPGPWVDESRRAGEVQGHPTGGRPPADHRWAGSRALASHRARARHGLAAQATAAGVACAADPPAAQGDDLGRLAECSADLWEPDRAISTTYHRAQYRIGQVGLGHYRSRWIAESPRSHVLPKVTTLGGRGRGKRRDTRGPRHSFA